MNMPDCKRVLLVKTSSLGDVVHTLPAITDAMQAHPGIRFEWVVEPGFAPIARRHPAVEKVISAPLREWRRHPFRTWRSDAWREFRAAIAGPFDLVLDAQGLIKSAFVTRLAGGPKVGLDRQSAREPLAARVLDRPIAVARGQHAVNRTRQLFAAALGYPMPVSAPDYGLAAGSAAAGLANGSRLVFCHGTTWENKHWPQAYWRRLLELAVAEGFRVDLPWGNEAEKQRAESLAEGLGAVTVLPAMSLDQLLDHFLGLQGFVAVDTGLAHLAAAAGLPGVGLYGPTDPTLTGVTGEYVTNLSAQFPCAPCLKRQCTYPGATTAEAQPPCFATVPPEAVWQALRLNLSRGVVAVEVRS